MTKEWTVSGTHPGPEAIEAAAALLRDGALVAFPTETVYGLGADATRTEAVARIFSAKGRPSDNPLIVHIADRSQLDDIVLPYGELATRLMEAFWPGPLTIVLPVREGAVSPLVTAGLTTVGVRVPDHPAALALLAAAGCPVAAPSANRSGRPSPTQAHHVREDLGGRIEGLLDAGPTGVGLESTVIQLLGDHHIHILRPGGVTADALKAAAPEATLSAATEEAPAAPRSPGMKYTHYAPHGLLTLVQGGSREEVAAWINEALRVAKQRGETTGVLTPEEDAPRFAADLVVPCGSLRHPETFAANLYAALRAFDEAGISYILAPTFPTQGIGEAVMNRLTKAAGNRIIQI